MKITCMFQCCLFTMFTRSTNQSRFHWWNVTIWLVRSFKKAHCGSRKVPFLHSLCSSLIENLWPRVDFSWYRQNSVSLWSSPNDFSLFNHFSEAVLRWDGAVSWFFSILSNYIFMTTESSQADKVYTLPTKCPSKLIA